MTSEGASREFAVIVEGAVKGYGSHQVLQGLNMKVPYGSIYGLLGASGCGKTTLLQCILGEYTLEEGKVEVLGKTPGTRGHQVPGRDVGYMPQELALYGDFTMAETMFYFGILHRMKRKEIKSRHLFLTGLLDLPQKDKLIKKMSGGQKRRFSFAVALLQQPPLLILDEPTVGVDPVLRAKIWDYLVETVASSHTTIIITTHYVEEARQANLVGMMRQGLLLVEQSPTFLMDSFRVKKLEEVFFHYCKQQDLEQGSMKAVHGTKQTTTDSEEESSQLISSSSKIVEDKKDTSFCGKIYKRGASTITRCSNYNLRSSFPKPTNIAALLWKSFVYNYNNPALFISYFIVPLVSLSIVYLAIGKNLKGLKVVYVNEDTLPAASFNPFQLCNGSSNDKKHRHYSNLGDLYVDQVKYHTDLDADQFPNYREALDQVKDGHAWGVIYIGESFTMDLVHRLCSASLCTVNPFTEPVTNEIVNGSTIHIQRDMSNYMATRLIKQEILKSDALFTEEFLRLCSNVINVTSGLFSPVIQIGTPVYGKIDAPFFDFMFAGFFNLNAAVSAITLTGMVLLRERTEGLIERSWVAGVNSAEIIIANILANILISVVQVVLTLLLGIYVFDVYTARKAVFYLMMIQGLAMGFTGLALGLFISAICPTESAAMQAISFAFYPMILLGGLLWPVQGMPDWLHYISNCLPFTVPNDALRSIMARGWELDHEQIWLGLLIPLAWFILILFLAGLCFDFRK